MAVAFLDDILFWSKDKDYINKLELKLHEQGLLLKQENNAVGVLGVDMTRTEEGYIKIKQTGLIDQILEALGFDLMLATNKWTPVKAKPLT